MATNIRSWGILGNPSKEKIEEYKNMPVGSFQSMIKRLSKSSKNKVMQEFTVYVTKRKVDMTRGVIKTEAFEFSEATNIARELIDQVAWDETPYETNKEELVFQIVDPLKYR
jgi:hypothetical protein